MPGTRQNLFALPGPSILAALRFMYGCIAVYGTVLAVVGSPTIDEVAGRVYGLLFPFAVIATAVCSYIGVHRTELRPGHYQFEFWSTLALIAAFGGYIAAIVSRSAMDGNFTRLSAAFLVVVFSVFPLWRIRNLLNGGGRG